MKTQTTTHTTTPPHAHEEAVAVETKHWRKKGTSCLKRSLKAITGALVLAVMSATLASAGSIPIPGLCSTGMNSSCTGTATIGSIDPNWTLATPYPSSPSGQPLPSPPWNLTYGPAYVNTPNGFWLANSSTSQWTTPQNESNLGGNYVYATSFNIPVGYDPATASITGFWTSDNEGIEVWLNQQQITGFPLPGAGDSDKAFPFTINSSDATFQSGLNTLYFEIRNRGLGGNDNDPTDTGIRVEFQSSLVGAAPEPSSLLLMGSGVLGLGGVLRRKLKA